MSVGNSLPPVSTDMLRFKEHFEDTALDTAEHKRVKWLRYVDDNFVVWSRGPTRMEQFLHHFNSLRYTIIFTAEVEVYSKVTDLHKALLANGSAKTFQHTSGQQYRSSVCYVVRAVPSARQRSCKHASLIEERCFLCGPRHAQ
jgi:hypothetical protein